MSQLPVKELRIEQRKISGRRINYMIKENQSNEDGGDGERQEELDITF